MLNNQNMLATYDYYMAAMYDLMVRTGLMIVTMSPNAVSASVGASAAALWDDLSQKAFNKLDEAWSNRAMLASMSIAQLSLIMGNTVMKEAEIAYDIYNLLFALDNAIVFDPPLNTELVTFSVKDVVIPDGEASGKGEVLVSFRNDGEKAVMISPSVSIYNSSGWVAAAEFSSTSKLILPGETTEFYGSFTVNGSVLLDSTGYSAVLNYSACEPETVSIAAEQGPFVKHFYAGTDRQIAAMRNKVSAGTMVSGWVTGQDTLTGSITVKAGQSLRIFAAAPVNGKITVEITSPSGETVAAESFINVGDYAIINNCEAGDYTVKVTTPEGFDNRITVEGVVSSFDKAITAVHTDTEALINCNSKDDDGRNYGTISFSVSESAGKDAGVISAELEFEDDNLTAELSGLDDLTLTAGGTLDGSFIIRANSSTPAGVYTGTLKVCFDAETCDPVFLSLAAAGDDADNWSFEGDKVVYTAQITVTVDLSVPAVPEFTAEDGEEEGTVKLTGSAPGAALVIVTYDYDIEAEDEFGETETYTAKTVVAVFEPEADGSFTLTLAKPEADSRISVIAVNAVGGMSDAATVEVEGYSEPEEESEKNADPFTSVSVTQVDGKRDVDVTVYGAQNIGLNLTGDIYYRVVDTEPGADYPVSGEFDPSEWISAGTDTSFTVKNVSSGQYIEVVQVASENVYTFDENGELTVKEVRYSVLRHSSAAVELEDVPGYTVSGTLVPDDDRANAEGAVLILTDTTDSSKQYTTTVHVTDGVAAYSFTDVVSGTYVLSVDSSESRIKADSVLITVEQSDVSKDIDVVRNIYDVTGTITKTDARAYLYDMTVILLDGSGNELARTVARVIDSETATYSFTDLSAGSYSIRIESDMSEADDTAFSITDSDVTEDIAVRYKRIPGDINGDREVDDSDFIIFFRYLTDWDVVVNEDVIDVNGDGKVNNKDLTRLYQYLEGWDVELC